MNEAPPPQLGASPGWIQHEPDEQKTAPGWPALPGSQAVNFVTAAPTSLQKGQKLYRVFGGSSLPKGYWWSPAPPPSNEAAWRAGLAVESEWNNGKHQVVATVTAAVAVWSGRATAQPADDATGKALAPGFLLPGGAQQINVDPAHLDLGTPSPTPWAGSAAAAAAAAAAPPAVGAPHTDSAHASVHGAAMHLAGLLERQARGAAPERAAVLAEQAANLRRGTARLGAGVDEAVRHAALHRLRSVGRFVHPETPAVAAAVEHLVGEASRHQLGGAAFAPKPGAVTVNGQPFTLVAFYYDDHYTPWDVTYNAPFLGNFWPSPVTLQIGARTASFHTAEAAFQATKWWSDDAIVAQLEAAKTGAEAFSLSRHITAPKEDYAGLGRRKAMQAVLRSRFADPTMKAGLLATGAAYLLEHDVKVRTHPSGWSDNHDGLPAGGQAEMNMLGGMLMALREALGGAGAPAGRYAVSDFSAAV